jgi:hypothetical protein
MLLFVICLLLLFAVSYMFCFNVPLLNSLSAKKKKKEERKKKKKKKKDHPKQNRINLVCQVKWKVEISLSC